MKKIFLSLILFVSLNSFAQDLSGTVNLTLRAGDWSFIAGRRVTGLQDSSTIIYLNRLRDTLLVANPATFNTNVRFNSIPAHLVYSIYTEIKSLTANLYDAVGTNISTQIKAIASTPLQTAITNFDNSGTGQYQETRRRGKNFLSDH